MCLHSDAIGIGLEDRACLTRGAVVRCRATGHYFYVLKVLKPLLGFKVKMSMRTNEVESTDDTAAVLLRCANNHYFGANTDRAAFVKDATGIVVLLWNPLLGGLVFGCCSASSIDDAFTLSDPAADDVSEALGQDGWVSCASFSALLPVVLHLRLPSFVCRVLAPAPHLLPSKQPSMLRRRKLKRRTLSGLTPL